MRYKQNLADYDAVLKYDGNVYLGLLQSLRTLRAAVCNEIKCGDLPLAFVFLRKACLS